MAPKQSEPIALVGAGCRFPGGASSPSRLWDLVREPWDCSSEIPKDRFSWEGYYSSTPRHGTTQTKRSYFIQQDLRKFDAQFFNITPAEADAVDPQQRLLLETVYEGLETAGLRMEDLQGSSTAVFVGLMGCDYADVMQRDAECVPIYIGTGTARSIHSNRISYFFDWHGPSMSIDTACSSSMVAIHLGVQALRSGESKVAVACGTSMILGPEYYIFLSNLNMLATDGRGKMWDASADGYARGEGVASIVMKKLSDAIADGDPIQCVIRETGVNQDGRTKGITVPSAQAQAALIRDTYRRAGLDLTTPAGRPQYFEAHGTGTPVGDPNEAEAINNAFFPAGGVFGADEVIQVGGIKTVIGHTEGTAGMAGILKVVQALQHQQIPPNLLFDTINPAVAQFTKHLSLATELKPWPTVPNGAPRRASVNSFGFGGSNGHAILEAFHPEQYQVVSAAPQQSADERHGQIVTTPFTFSAQSERVLHSVLKYYVQYLQNTDVNLRDLAWSLQTKRSALAYKVTFSAHNIDLLLAQLEDKLPSSPDQTKGQAVDPIGIKSSASSKAPILGIFTGQGAQWALMGAELYKSSSKFRDIFALLDDSLAKLPAADRPSWSLAEELLKDASTSRVNEAAISQPLCNAVQVALVDMLESAHVRLSAVVGHSSGEIAAAYAAGFISSFDAIRIAYYRGFYARLAGGADDQRGAMLAVGTSVDDCRELCEDPDFEGRVTVAAVNSSSSVTIAGDADAIADLEVLFQEEKKFARMLKVQVAYHSHHMQPCAEPYLEALAACDIKVKQPSPEAPSWYSSVRDGELMAMSEQLAGEYWKMNMTQTVQFSAALEAALDQTDGQFGMAVEVGPHPALKSPVIQILQDVLGSGIPYTGVLSRKENDVNAFSSALGSIWTNLGASAVDFESYDRTFFPEASKPSFPKDLPLYPWDRERSYWSESRVGKLYRTRSTPPHALIGSPYGDKVDGEFKWRNFLIAKEMPWVYGHRIQGEPVMPAAGYLAMAWEAAMTLVQGQPVRLIEVQDFRVRQGLNFRDESSGIETIITLSKVTRDDQALLADWAIHSCLSKDSVNLSLVAEGKISLILGEQSSEILPRDEGSLFSMVDVNVDDFYNALSELGYGYTGIFRGVTTLERKMNRSAGTLVVPTDAIMTNLAVVDISFQSLFAALGFPGDGGLWSLHVPTFVKTIRVNPICGGLPEGDELELTFEAEYVEGTEGTLGNVTVYTPDGQNGLMTIEGFASMPFAKASAADDRNLFQKTVWAENAPNGDSILDDAQYNQEQVDVGLLCERVAHFYLKHLVNVITEQQKAKSDHKDLMRFASHVVQDLSAGTSPFGKTEWANDTEAQILSLISRYPDQIDLKMMRALGEAYPSIVRGETTTLEHLLKDDMLNDFYARGLGFQEANIWTARIIKQISHRFPHMKMMEIGAGTGGATMEILKNLRTGFSSYTYTDISAAFFEQAKVKFAEFANRMTFKAFDVEKDVESQDFGEDKFDLIVASNVLHVTKNVEEVMQNVRKLLKPGGFLVMLEITDNHLYRLAFDMGGLPQWWIRPTGGRNWGPTLSAVQWNNALLKAGFSGIDTMATLRKSVVNPFSVLVSQAVDDRVMFLRQPLDSQGTEESLGDLIVIGGSSLESSRLIRDINKKLSMRFETVTVYDDLEAVAHAGGVPVPTTILSLTELDEPIFKSMTGEKLAALQLLFKDHQNILWVTRGCRSEEPLSNMTVGFFRSLSCELQELRLQLVDFEDKVDPTAICESLLHLRVTDFWSKEGQTDEILWSREPEVVVQDGKQLIPRICLEEDQNARYDSSKREFTKELSIREHPITLSHKKDSIVAVESPKIKRDGVVSGSKSVNVQVVYSMLYAIKTPTLGPVYLSIGKIAGTDKIGCVLSHSNSSMVDVSEDDFFPIDIAPGREKQALLLVASELMAYNLMDAFNIRNDILVNGGQTFLFDAISRRAAKIGQRAYRLASDLKVKDACSVVIHPFESTRNIMKKLPSGLSAYLSLTDGVGGGSVGKSVEASLPSGCNVIHRDALYSLYHDLDSGREGSAEEVRQLVKTACSYASLNDQQDIVPEDLIVSLREIRDGMIKDPMTVVDWTKDDSVLVNIQPVDTNLKFASDKTYWLVGLTGDLGLTLCDWLIRHGARSIVISSRKPAVSKEWIKQCEDLGAKISLFALDVTDKKNLASVYEEIRQNLPPIAGVVNAAMVLDDVMFDNMQIDNLLPVLRPKVNGSRNLDELFAGVNLDFFVLFSSLGWIVGNTGQSAYVAANGYLDALTTQRRGRGLPASAMHIGAIVGAGYITRAGQLTTTDIKLYGATPLSVSDFHQLFAEAVLASPADSGLNPLLIAGLRTIDPLVDDQALWRRNPKFSHLWVVNELTNTAQGGSMSNTSVSSQLLQATTTEQVQAYIQEGFAARLIALLQLLPEDMDVTMPLTEMGVDSLVAVGARAWFTKELGVDIPVLKILGGTSVVDLVQDAIEKLSAELIPNVGGDTQVTSTKVVEAATLLAPGSPNTPPETPSSPETTSEPANSTDLQEIGHLDTPPSELSAAQSDTDEFKPVIIRKTRASYTQSRFWYLKQSLEDTTALNITFSYHLEGKYNTQQLSRAILKIGEVHEGLRTCFFDEDGTPMQGILEKSPLFMEVKTIKDESEAHAEYEKLDKHIYDLESGRTMRIMLLELSPTSAWLITGYHHIAMDGAGFSSILSEMWSVSKPGGLTPPTLQYADYTDKEYEEVESGVMAKDVSYWEKTLATAPPVLPLLPFAKVQSRRPMTRFAFSSASSRIDPVLNARIKRKCRNFQATAFHFYLTIFNALLFRFTGIDEVCVGIADSNRSDEERQRTMGCLVNIIPLRFKALLAKTFTAAIKETRKTAYAALSRSRVPFNVILDAAQADRSSTHFPLFQAFVDYRPGIQEHLTVGDVDVKRVEWSYGKNAYDINLEIMENARGDAFITINAQEYLYSQPHVQMLLDIFMRLVESFSKNSALRLDEPVLFDKDEMDKTLTLGKGPEMASEWPSTIIRRIEDVSRRSPEVNALRDGHGMTLTYTQMMDETHKIADSLRNAGVKPGDKVVVFQQPTCLSICSLLAIMRVGAAYMPLDLRSPVSRLQAIVDDCKPAAMLTHKDTARFAALRSIPKTINVSELGDVVATPGQDDSSASEAAVILFTSGSTGTPKGVILTHSGIKNVIEGMTRQYDLGAQTVLQSSSLTFDLSLNQIFIALANGGTLYVVPQSKRGDAVAICKTIVEQDISYTLATPSEYAFWLRFGAEDLRLAARWTWAFSCGEELKQRVKEEFRQLRKDGLRLVNTYGPAEITIQSHATEIDIGDFSTLIPAGHSLPNYGVYILDQNQQPLPAGMSGEICVGGAGVSMGYLNLPQLTGERFLANPFAPAAWKENGWTRMYRTGDRGYLRSDGSLIFQGRMDGDTQIKLRGIRIELGEIETTLVKAARANLDEVVVSLRGEDESTQFLVAHAVFARDSKVAQPDGFLRQVLAEAPLPPYMRPAMMIALERMPLTSHHKTDRKAVGGLPLPEDLADRSNERPLTSVENELVRLWAKVLPHEVTSSVSIRPGTSFFDVGGSSLSLIPLRALINETFNVLFNMNDFADTHTLDKMASRIQMTTISSAIDWDAETSIDDIAVPDLAGNVLPHRRGKGLRVLYTGATGHSAKFILKKLVEDDRIETIYCIGVRERAGYASPRKTSVESDKILIYRGDICQERLGLSEEDYYFLAAHTDAILHCAANRSLWDYYPALRQANMVATKVLIGMAIPRRVPFHFLSSSAVQMFGHPDMDHPPQGSATTAPPTDGSEGYLASKWATEKVLEKVAARDGLPVYFHRPAPVSPNPTVTQEELFAELMRVTRLLRLHVADDSISGHVDLLRLDDLGAKLDAAIVESTSTGTADGERELVRYVHHMSDARVEMGSWRRYFDEHAASSRGEDRALYQTEVAVEWVGKAKLVGFPYMLAAQNFNIAGSSSSVPIVQRR